jgi:hypothetical protein
VLFEMPLSPMACTRSSTRRVETPLILNRPGFTGEFMVQ